MTEFVTVSTSQNSSQFNSVFKNFRKPRQELKDIQGNIILFDFSVLNLRINSTNFTAACGNSRTCEIQGLFYDFPGHF